MTKVKPPGLLNAARWTIVSNVLQEVISGALTFVLAAFLLPAEFGIVAMGYIYITFMEVILGLGFSTALIQRRDTTDIHLNSVFWINQACGLSFALIAMGFSGWWSRSNGMPALQPMLIVLSAMIPVNSLAIVQSSILQKNMDFKGLAVRNNLATLAGGIVGIALAATGFGAWALVWQYIAKSLAGLALLWRISSWRPGFRFSWSAIKDLRSFAGKTLFGQVGVFAQQQADSLVIGFLLGPSSLGLCRLADRLVEMNLKFLPRALQLVSLPHFSKLQDNRAELNKSLLVGVHLNSMMTFPSFAFMMGASTVILGAVGQQWREASTVLRILCLVGVSKALLLLIGPLLQAMSKAGRNSINTWVLACANVFVTFMVARAVSGHEASSSVVYVMIGRACVFLLVFMPLVLWQANQASGLSLREVLRVSRPGLATSFVVGTSQWLLSHAGFPAEGSWRFVVLGIHAVLALATWLLCVRLFDNSGWSYVTRMLTRLKGFGGQGVRSRPSAGLDAPVQAICEKSSK